VALIATLCLDPLMLPWMRREPAPVHATDVHCVGRILATSLTVMSFYYVGGGRM